MPTGRMTEQEIDEKYESSFYMGMDSTEVDKLLKEKEFLKMCMNHLRVNIKSTEENQVEVELLFHTSDGGYITIDKETTYL